MPGSLYLCNYISVSEPDDQTILRSVVFVLVLGDQPLPSTIVSPALYSIALLKLHTKLYNDIVVPTSAPPKLNLVPLEVSLIFDHFDERLSNRQKHFLKYRSDTPGPAILTISTSRFHGSF